jgi:saccharopine dehydrogenase-like NADP-dependent oxidoreductase
MPQCGLAPGFIGIAAHHLAAGFEEVHDIKMWGAAAVPHQ